MLLQRCKSQAPCSDVNLFISQLNTFIQICVCRFSSSSSLSFEVWWGKDRPQRTEVGCDRPGTEPPQTPSRPACLSALLGNPWQVCLLSYLFHVYSSVFHLHYDYLLFSYCIELSIKMRKLTFPPFSLSLVFQIHGQTQISPQVLSPNHSINLWPPSLLRQTSCRGRPSDTIPFSNIIPTLTEEGQIM